MPNNHHKPSKEELETELQEITAEAEALAANPPKEVDEETPEPEVKLDTFEPEPEPEKEEPKEEEVEPSKELYKKKFSASSRENQKIYAKNRIINKALVEADDIPEPTEDELTREFKDWEIMSDTEKALAKETIISRKWRETISKAKEQATKIEKWNDSVDEFVDDPKTFIDYPELEGKADTFREFATSEENNSVPFTTLVGAFLYKQSTAKVEHKGKMFENGSGGPNTKPQPKNGKITLEESRILRETNYDKWKEMLMSGKIEDNV